MARDRLYGDDLQLFRKILETGGHRGIAEFFQISRPSLYRAASGAEMQHATVVLIRLGIRLFDSEKTLKELVRPCGEMDISVLRQILGTSTKEKK